MIHNTTLMMGTAVLAFAAMAGERAAADVVSVGANGFEIRETAHTAASSDKVYAALLLPAHWWSSDHTFSGSAANLVLDAHAGGCWCETLPGGGSVEHLRVVFVSPGKTLRLRGALGPFQGLAVDGVMTWSVKSVADGTDVTFTYSIGGYAKDGFDELSKMTDRVLGEQMERFKKSVDGESAPRAH
jgi:Polyketide cyclase / dehydrase and lipid transport